jgi:hypothetical protein
MGEAADEQAQRSYSAAIPHDYTRKNDKAKLLCNPFNAEAIPRSAGLACYDVRK